MTDPNNETSTVEIEIDRLGQITLYDALEAAADLWEKLASGYEQLGKFHLAEARRNKAADARKLHSLLVQFTRVRILP